MKELKPRIHENGIDYILVGDYYVPGTLSIKRFNAGLEAAGGTPSHWQVGQSSQGVFETVLPCPLFDPCPLR